MYNLSVTYKSQAKAESLIINSVGYRPTDWSAPFSLALKGRYQDFALSGLRLRGLRQNRALPYSIDYKAFSLSLTDNRTVIGRTRITRMTRILGTT